MKLSNRLKGAWLILIGKPVIANTHFNTDISNIDRETRGVTFLDCSFVSDREGIL